VTNIGCASEEIDLDLALNDLGVDALTRRCSRENCPGCWAGIRTLRVHSQLTHEEGCARIFDQSTRTLRSWLPATKIAAPRRFCATTGLVYLPEERDMTECILSDEEIRKLNRDLRILIATNGALTRILNVVADDEIVVQIIKQQIHPRRTANTRLGATVGIASLPEDNRSLLSPSIFFLRSVFQDAPCEKPIVANIRTTSTQGLEIDLHLMIGSREAPCADNVRSQPLYPWIEIALRIAQPLGGCLFDRQARNCVDLRSLVPNGEDPLSPCDATDRRITVAVAN